MTIYNIPGDKGLSWRAMKFVDYHALGDADMNFPLLIRYCDSHKLTQTNRFWMAFLYSTCYCVATTCFLYESLPLAEVTKGLTEEFWNTYKSRMIFQSDKRYVKNMNWFVTLVDDFLNRVGRNPVKYFKPFKGSTPQDTYDNLYAEAMTWKYFGRFTVFLLIEAISKLTSLKSDSGWFDWKNGNTATSGMLHILYKDEEAIEFDKSTHLDVDTLAKLTDGLEPLRQLISSKHPTASVNITDIETSLCGFRKLFKGSRYGGYYIDRVQEEIICMQEALPEKAELWEELWNHRRDSFNPLLLGEVMGYQGIQKQRNKEWLEKGLSGVEALE